MTDEKPDPDRVEEVVMDLHERDDLRPYHTDYDTGEIRLKVLPKPTGETAHTEDSDR